MKKYNVTISAVCDRNQRYLWEQEIHNGYVISFLGSTAMLEGFSKTEEELRKVDYLVRRFPDHHIIVKEVYNDEKGEGGQAPPLMG